MQADVFAGNVASGRVLEKLRFRREGYFVDDGVIDGAPHGVTVSDTAEWNAAVVAFLAER